jgi:Holliday junction resolvase RusA-like endonuclease
MVRFIVKDVVLALDAEMNRSISFDVVGEPPVQQRPRITYKKRDVPVYYDPSGSEKRIYKQAVRTGLQESAITVFPIFSSDPMVNAGLSITMVFYLSRRVVDYRIISGVTVVRDNHQLFPPLKDVDNMAKFVMDALHDVMYDNDNCVVKITARKEFVEGDPYTTVLVQQI